jgi:Uma2 family endonuclease
MPSITDISQLDFSKSYTYADYATWQFRERVELIMGKIFMMSQAPTSKHQAIVSELHGALHYFLKGKVYRVFPAPFDVQLPLDPNVRNNVVQPDLCVICDPSKIKPEGCVGAPDLVVEVVSKSSVTRDIHEKYALYEQAGVKEYWLVNPIDKSLIIFVLDETGHYKPAKPLTMGDMARSTVLPGLAINLSDVFANVVEEPEEGYYPNAVGV